MYLYKSYNGKLQGIPWQQGLSFVKKRHRFHHLVIQFTGETEKRSYRKRLKKKTDEDKKTHYLSELLTFFQVDASIELINQ